MDTLRKFFEIGALDRMAGLAILTHEQHCEANPNLDAEDQDDTYRAYRCGYISGHICTT